MPDWIANYTSVAPTAITALLSACVAWATTRLSVRTEIQKLRLGVQQKLLEQLVAARLVVYPDLYFLLSELPKASRAAVGDASALRKLLEQVNVWDSKNAILLGPHSPNVCYEFRRTLAAAASAIHERTAEDAKQQKAMHAVFSQAELLELALRSDLGIYGVEVLHAPGLLRTPRVRKY